MRKTVELLAPAGNSEALHAAVENGADAVYLGGKMFNARQQADNFDMQQLRDELRYAHARGVNIYLTLNTLLHDDEIPKALAYADEACNAGIDGIIVQDIGLAAALRSALPGLPLHGSTQMTVYDSEGVHILEEMGFRRVVLARELTLEQASQIARSTSLEVEMFVHGAMCVCYSGQCLMSSMIGGRSGNRGMCAQPCRLTYTLAEDGSHPAGSAKQPRYLLSPKDMNTLEYLAEIAASGVKSLKIEGRMKSPEYVATVVRIYRKYLDIALEQAGKGASGKLSIDEKDRHDLLQIFNRGGFSSGYLKGKTGSDMMSYEKPNNSGICIGEAIAYDAGQQTIKIRLENELSAGDGIEIWTGGSDSPGGIASMIKVAGRNVKKAEKGALAEIGYFKGRIVPGRKVYKTTDQELIKVARQSYTGRNIKRIAVKGTAILREGRPLIVTAADEEGHSVTAEGTVLPEAAVNKPLTMERLKEQLNKTGSTPFIFSELGIDLQDGLTLPVSEINDVRRKALDSLYDARAERYSYGRCNEEQSIRQAVDEGLSCRGRGVKLLHRKESPLIAVYLYKWEQGTDLADIGADRIYLPFSAMCRSGFEEAVKSARNSGKEVFCWLPAVTKGNYEKLLDKFIQDISEKPEGQIGIDGILASNIGTVQKLRGINRIKLAGDISLNLFNAYSAAKAASLGIDSAAISVELNMRQIYEMTENLGRTLCIAEAITGEMLDTAACEKAQGSLGLEAAVYGRLPLMISEYCPVGSVKGDFCSSSKCSGCCSRGSYTLQDRLGLGFPVLCDNIDCRSTVLNSSVLFVPDSLKNLTEAGISIFRLYIWDEDPDTVKGLVSLFRAAAAGVNTDTAGFDGLTEKIKAKGFTKGHYYRGV